MLIILSAELMGVIFIEEVFQSGMKNCEVVLQGTEKLLSLPESSCKNVVVGNDFTARSKNQKKSCSGFYGVA